MTMLRRFADARLRSDLDKAHDARDQARDTARRLFARLKATRHALETQAQITERWRSIARDAQDQLAAERAHNAKLREVAQTYREVMVGQHEWAGHLIDGDCPDCIKAGDEMDGSLACDRYRQWQREYENALSTYTPQETQP